MEVEFCETNGQETDSSGDDSFDEEGPTTYHEWKAFVVKTYLNGKNNNQQKHQPSSPIINNNRNHQPHNQPQPHHQPHHQPQSQPFKPNKLDFKAKIAGNNTFLGAQVSRPIIISSNLPPPPSSSNHHRQKPEEKHFKIPDRDASGNPIVMQTTSNPFAKPKQTTINANSNGNRNGNTSMTDNHNFATVTSSLNKTARVQMPSSSMPNPLSSVPSSRITKGSNYQENNLNPVAKSQPSDNLKTRNDVFWSLNSAAKLIHVKSQLDESSKIYVDKLVKNHGIAQKEIIKLKKEKQDLINTIKMVEKVISDPQVTHN